MKQAEKENRNTSPYQRITARSTSPAPEEENDKIVYYREQRKTM